MTFRCGRYSKSFGFWSGFVFRHHRRLLRCGLIRLLGKTRDSAYKARLERSNIVNARQTKPSRAPITIRLFLISGFRNPLDPVWQESCRRRRPRPSRKPCHFALVCGLRESQAGGWLAGQANIKRYSRKLCKLIHDGRSATVVSGMNCR
jgi:hypothetical protein